MDDKISRLLQKEAERLRVLDALYELTDGNPHAAALMTDVYEKAGVDWATGSAAYQYLQSERLVVGHTSHRLAITHSGVKEREAAIAGLGAKGTEHFPQAVVQHVIQHFNAPVYGAIQTGGHGNVANVKNTAGTPAGDLASLLTQLREHAHALPDGERELALDHVDRLHQEASADSPNTLRMKMWLEGLKVFGPLVPIVAQVMTALAGVGA